MLNSAVLLLALAASTARADCYENLFGQVYCSDLSTGARIGIGIGVAVGVILLLSLIMWAIRRRRLRRNTYPVAAAPYQQQSGYNYYGNQQPQNPPTQPYQPQFEQQQTGHAGYSNQQNYAPPSYPPPTEKVV